MTKVGDKVETKNGEIGTVVHVSPTYPKDCDHEFSDDETGQTDMYGACTKCGMSFQRYIHTECP
jgi:predicted Zn-ribbon and HTH transcriptional regulator